MKSFFYLFTRLIFAWCWNLFDDLFKSRRNTFSVPCFTGANVSNSPIFSDLKEAKSWTLKGNNQKPKIWNNPEQREVEEYRILNANLVPQQTTLGRDRGWEGGGEGYWRKVSLEEQDSFLPSHPLTLPCDKLSQQVVYSARQPGEMAARLSSA